MDMENTGDLIARRKNKIVGLKESGVDLFPNDFRFSHTVTDVRTMLKKPESVSENDPIFSLAGRMMAVNRFGKTTFIRFRDRTGQLQAYIRKDRVGMKPIRS